VTRVAQKDGNAVLNKPFTLESIRAAIGKVCRPVDPVEAPSPAPAASPTVARDASLAARDAAL
jgi:hypothetical protein